MPEPTRTYRSRATHVEAIRWINHNTSCDAVYRFLGLNVGPHPNHDLFEIPGGTYQNVTWPGGWIVRYPNGRLRACSDATFTAEFEAAGEPETFTWGESVGTDHDNICIPVNRGDTWIGDIKLPVKAAWELSDMLADLLDDVAREQQSGRERCD